MSPTEARREATAEDLHRVVGKAELINGVIVEMPPTGDAPNHAAGSIFASLLAHSRRTGAGRPVTDNAGFLVNLANRRSFSPDAAYWTGPPAGMKFFDGAPIFAVEVRSAGDYGSAAEREMAAKRADYFLAGTSVVWDVDLQADTAVVRSFAAGEASSPTLFRRGETASADAAVPGWSMPVDELLLPER